MAECELLVRVTGYGFCAGLVTNGDNRIVMCAPILRKHVQFNNANLSAFLAYGQRKGWTFDYVEPMQAPDAGVKPTIKILAALPVRHLRMRQG